MSIGASLRSIILHQINVTFLKLALLCHFALIDVYCVFMEIMLCIQSIPDIIHIHQYKTNL